MTMYSTGEAAILLSYQAEDEARRLRERVDAARVEMGDEPGIARRPKPLPSRPHT